MPIYDVPVRLLMVEMFAALCPEPDSLFTRSEAVDWFRTNYPRIKPGTVTVHLAKFSTNAPSRINYNQKPDDDMLFQLDRTNYRRYRPGIDPTPIRVQEDATKSSNPLAVEEPDAEEDSVPSEFAYEADLKRFLIKNPALVEPGLSIYEDEGTTGVEFPAGGRFIDILAVSRGGDLVVIELKVSKGYDRVVGQLLRYVAWIRANLAEDGQRVRGIIIAREISEDLVLATSVVPDVELIEYTLSVSLRRKPQATNRT